MFTKTSLALRARTQESLIKVKGTIVERPEDQVTDSNVEIESESISVMSPSRTSTSSSPSRHMAIRRSSDLLTNLKVRSSVSHSVRSYLNDGLDFVEVETPTLFKSTPEGAREFLVPSRKRGKFYALTQSPQQYKQILMSAGTSLQNHSLN